MKILIKIFLLAGLAPVGAQDLAALGPQSGSVETVADVSDTVSVKRGMLTTAVYQRGEKLSYTELWGLYHAYPEASRSLKWSKPLRIAGPVVAAGGVVLGAVALKGTSHTAEIEGRTYDYTKRSKAQLLGGLALLAGGICLFELSNDLVARSARKYNEARITRGKQALLAPENMKVGITPEGNIGILLRL